MTAGRKGAPPRNGETSELFEQSEAPKQNSKTDLSDISTAAQRARILDALRQGPVTTIGARRDLAVMRPGMRICELRKRGYDIRMIWSREPDELGVLHRQGEYFLLAKVEIS